MSKDKFIKARVSESEYLLVAEEADRKNMSVAQYIRYSLGLDDVAQETVAHNSVAQPIVAHKDEVVAQEVVAQPDKVAARQIGFSAPKKDESKVERSKDIETEDMYSEEMIAKRRKLLSLKQRGVKITWPNL